MATKSAPLHSSSTSAHHVTPMSSVGHKGKVAVLELAAERIDMLGRTTIPKKTVPDRPLEVRELRDITSAEDLEELDAYVKGIIPHLSDESDVRTLSNAYEKRVGELEARAKVSVPHTPEAPEHMKTRTASGASVVEVPVGSEVKEVNFSRQLGLKGPSRSIKVDKEGLQERLNLGFRDLAMLIQTDDPMDAHISSGGSIHTITVHRTDSSGKTRPVYYDLNHDSEIKRLIRDNTASVGSPGIEKTDEEVAALRTQLNEIGKELDEVMEEISPRSNRSSTATYESGSVNNTTGLSPFAQVGPRVGKTIMDKDYFEKTLLPLFKTHGLTNAEGKLNKHGVRAYKEVAAALTLRKEEAGAISRKLSAARIKLAGLEKDTDLNLLDTGSQAYKDIEALREQIKVLSNRESELGEISEFSVSWMIVQLNTPIQVTYSDDTREKMNVRKALTIKDDKFTVEGEGFASGGEEVSPLTMRQKLQTRASEEFSENVLKKTKGRFESDPHSTGFVKKRFRQKSLETKEKMGGFELGAMFFYPSMSGGDPDPSFRIQNQLRHDGLQHYTLCKDVPIGDFVSLANHFVDIQEAQERGADAPERAVKALQDYFDPKVFNPDDAGDQQKIQEVVAKTMAAARLFESGSTVNVKTPQNALNIMRDNGVVYEGRWFGRRWWDHGFGN
ncbi:hypothetical protein [Simkania sp.]|uniref:hypothetical protein n=1 Tax=Simkania sp. TaxID=34094 RepID=UPI003B5262FA